MPIAAGAAIAVIGSAAGAGLANAQIQGGKSGPQSAARGAQSAYAQTAPGQYALNREYQPAYVGLGQNNMNQMLFGTEGGLDMVEMPVVDKAGNITGYRQQYIRRDGAPGMVSMLSRANAEYAPQAKELWRQLYPEQAALQDQIAADASSQLGYGGAMDPRMTRQVQQATRAGQAARGLGYGPGDVFLEAMNTGDRAQALRTQRQQYALNAGSYLAQAQPNWTNSGGALLSGAMGPSFQTPMYDPFNPQATQMSLQNAKQNQAAAMARANNYAAMGGGISKAGAGVMQFG